MENIKQIERINVEVSPELKLKFKTFCTARGKSMKEVILDFVKKFIQEEK